MKIQTKKLVTALANLQRIVKSSANTLPVLSCVLIKVEGNRLSLTASNLDERQEEWLECEGTIESCCVNLNFIANAIGGEEVELTLDGQTLVIQFGQTVFKLGTIAPEEFPAVMQGEFSNIAVPCHDLANGVDAVAWCASKDPTRHIYQSVQLLGKPKEFRALSTDGRNVAMMKSALICPEFEILVPDGFAKNFADALRRKESVLSACENAVRVAHVDGAYWCKQVDGKYGNVDGVLPDEKKMKAVGDANKSDLVDIADKCLLFVDLARTPVVDLEFSKTGILAQFIGGGSGQKMSFSGKFKPQSFKLNAKSLKECASACPSETIQVYAHDSLPPIVFKDGDLTVISNQMAEA